MFAVYIREIGQDDRILPNYQSLEEAYNAAHFYAIERSNFFMRYGFPQGSYMKTHFTLEQAQIAIYDDLNPIMYRSPGMIPLISSEFVQVIIRRT